MYLRRILPIMLTLALLAACAPATAVIEPAPSLLPSAQEVEPLENTATSAPVVDQPPPADVTEPESAPAQAISTAAALPPANLGRLVQPSDLQYLGAFRLPEASGGSSWDYSGRGLTYYPDGDPDGAQDGFPGSLFGVGSDVEQFVSEISIPAPVVSKNLDDLNTAETLQPFADLTGGMFGETEIPRLGLQYLPALPGQSSGKLHFVHGQHFQDFQPSHGWGELDLSDPQPAGAWVFDGYTNYVTDDYVFEIPAEWAAQLPGAPRLASGRFREGVWGGGGPALFAYTPTTDGNPPAPNATLEGILPLLLYGVQEPGAVEISFDADMQMDGYNADDAWWGGAWLAQGEQAAVIFVGTKGLGISWYGFANGVEWAYDCAEQSPPTCPEVPPWPYENRGYWAEDYRPEILFFNPSDLVAVANGQLDSWQPQPYAALDLSEHFFNPELDLGNYKFDLAGAVAYDRERGLLYIIERLADEYKSVVHVWRVR